VTSADPSIQTSERLEPGDVDAVLALAGRAEAADGVGPLSEHARLHLARGGGPDLLARTSQGRVAGYAHLDGSDAELVVDPELRRQGVGRRLLAALDGLGPTESCDSGRLRVWAHGNRPAAQAFAASAGFEPVRELWQMQRSLTDPLPASKELDGLRLRAFRPGADEEAWLSVNARAFAHHPEQGGWTRTDLDEREASDWFDPAGLLLAEDVTTDGGRQTSATSGAAPGPTSGPIAGFHWTKEHREPDQPPIGEVYVLAVDPAYQGRGLGPALTAAGLEHLRSRGLSTVMLYVDGDNVAAIATYRRLGFERVALDVMYAHH
jgi:mycothiol synthase